MSASSSLARYPGGIADAPNPRSTFFVLPASLPPCVLLCPECYPLLAPYPPMQISRGNIDFHAIPKELPSVQRPDAWITEQIVDDSNPLRLRLQKLITMGGEDLFHATFGIPQPLVCDDGSYMGWGFKKWIDSQRPLSIIRQDFSTKTFGVDGFMLVYPKHDSPKDLQRNAVVEAALAHKNWQAGGNVLVALFTRKERSDSKITLKFASSTSATVLQVLMTQLVMEYRRFKKPEVPISRPGTLPPVLEEARKTVARRCKGLEFLQYCYYAVRPLMPGEELVLSRFTDAPGMLCMVSDGHHYNREGQAASSYRLAGCSLSNGELRSTSQLTKCGCPIGHLCSKRPSLIHGTDALLSLTDAEAVEFDVDFEKAPLSHGQRAAWQEMRRKEDEFNAPKIVTLGLKSAKAVTAVPIDLNVKAGGSAKGGGGWGSSSGGGSGRVTAGAKAGENGASEEEGRASKPAPTGFIPTAKDEKIAAAEAAAARAARARGPLSSLMAKEELKRKRLLQRKARKANGGARAPGENENNDENIDGNNEEGGDKSGDNSEEGEESSDALARKAMANLLARAEAKSKATEEREEKEEEENKARAAMAEREAKAREEEEAKAKAEELARRKAEREARARAAQEAKAAKAAKPAAGKKPLARPKRVDLTKVVFSSIMGDLERGDEQDEAFDEMDDYADVDDMTMMLTGGGYESVPWDSAMLWSPPGPFRAPKASLNLADASQWPEPGQGGAAAGQKGAAIKAAPKAAGGTSNSSTAYNQNISNGMLTTGSSVIANTPSTSSSNLNSGNNNDGFYLASTDSYSDDIYDDGPLPVNMLASSASASSSSSSSSSSFLPANPSGQLSSASASASQLLRPSSAHELDADTEQTASCVPLANSTSNKIASILQNLISKMQGTRSMTKEVMEEFQVDDGKNAYAKIADLVMKEAERKTAERREAGKNEVQCRGEAFEEKVAKQREAFEENVAKLARTAVKAHVKKAFLEAAAAAATGEKAAAAAEGGEKEEGKTKEDGKEKEEEEAAVDDGVVEFTGEIQLEENEFLNGALTKNGPPSSAADKKAAVFAKHNVNVDTSSLPATAFAKPISASGDAQPSPSSSSETSSSASGSSAASSAGPKKEAPPVKASSGGRILSTGTLSSFSPAASSTTLQESEAHEVGARFRALCYEDVNRRVTALDVGLLKSEKDAAAIEQQRVPVSMSSTISAASAVAAAFVVVAAEEAEAAAGAGAGAETTTRTKTTSKDKGEMSTGDNATKAANAAAVAAVSTSPSPSINEGSEGSGSGSIQSAGATASHVSASKVTGVDDVTSGSRAENTKKATARTTARAEATAAVAQGSSGSGKKADTCAPPSSSSSSSSNIFGLGPWIGAEALQAEVAPNGSLGVQNLLAIAPSDDTLRNYWADHRSHQHIYNGHTGPVGERRDTASATATSTHHALSGSAMMSTRLPLPASTSVHSGAVHKTTPFGLPDDSAAVAVVGSAAVDSNSSSSSSSGVKNKSNYNNNVVLNDDDNGADVLNQRSSFFPDSFHSAGHALRPLGLPPAQPAAAPDGGSLCASLLTSDKDARLSTASASSPIVPSSFGGLRKPPSSSSLFPMAAVPLTGGELFMYGSHRSSFSPSPQPPISATDLRGSDGRLSPSLPSAIAMASVGAPGASSSSSSSSSSVVAAAAAASSTSAAAGLLTVGIHSPAVALGGVGAMESFASALGTSRSAGVFAPPPGSLLSFGAAAAAEAAAAGSSSRSHSHSHSHSLSLSLSPSVGVSGHAGSSVAFDDQHDDGRLLASWSPNVLPGPSAAHVAGGGSSAGVNVGGAAVGGAMAHTPSAFAPTPLSPWGNLGVRPPSPLSEATSTATAPSQHQAEQHHQLQQSKPMALNMAHEFDSDRGTSLSSRGGCLVQQRDTTTTTTTTAAAAAAAAAAEVTKWAVAAITRDPMETDLFTGWQQSVNGGGHANENGWAKAAAAAAAGGVLASTSTSGGAASSMNGGVVSSSVGAAMATNNNAHFSVTSYASLTPPSSSAHSGMFSSDAQEQNQHQQQQKQQHTSSTRPTNVDGYNGDEGMDRLTHAAGEAPIGVAMAEVRPATTAKKEAGATQLDGGGLSPSEVPSDLEPEFGSGPGSDPMNEARRYIQLAAKKLASATGLSVGEITWFVNEVVANGSSELDCSNYDGDRCHYRQSNYHSHNHPSKGDGDGLPFNRCVESFRDQIGGDLDVVEDSGVGGNDGGSGGNLLKASPSAGRGAEKEEGGKCIGRMNGSDRGGGSGLSNNGEGPFGDKGSEEERRGERDGTDGRRREKAGEEGVKGRSSAKEKSSSSSKGDEKEHEKDAVRREGKSADEAEAEAEAEAKGVCPSNNRMRDLGASAAAATTSTARAAATAAAAAAEGGSGMKEERRATGSSSVHRSSPSSSSSSGGACAEPLHPHPQQLHLNIHLNLHGSAPSVAASAAPPPPLAAPSEASTVNEQFLRELVLSQQTRLVALEEQLARERERSAVMVQQVQDRADNQIFILQQLFQQTIQSGGGRCDANGQGRL